MSKNNFESVGTFVNVKNIIGNILYTKDDFIMCYINISPIITGIMTEPEKWSLGEQLTRAFARDKEVFTFLKIDKPINIKSVVNQYNDILNNLNIGVSTEKLEIKKHLLSASVEFLTANARTGETLENFYYLQLIRKFKNDNEMELINRAEIIMQKFRMAGVETELAGEDEIKDLCIYFSRIGNFSDEINVFSDEIAIVSPY